MIFPLELLLLMVPYIVSTTQTTDLILEDVDPAIGYHAIVKENDKNVEVTPEIKVASGPVSKFILTSKYPGEVPFRVFISNRTSGTAMMVVVKELDCEKRNSYKFNLMAVGLNGQVSDNITVHLSVEDMNEFAPTFLQNSYTVDVDEERLYDTIVQVEAQDDDCTPKYSDICKYEILDPHQPFTINFEGRIKNTEPLSLEQNPIYILSVVAYDCGMKRSEPTTVNIKVNKVCHLGWKGMHERIEYLPGSGRRILFPTANLDLCDVPCNLEQLTTSVDLVIQHARKDCDRDTYSVQSQRTLCGASTESADLLPTSDVGAEWIDNQPTDDRHGSDQIYQFDGATNAIMISESTLNHNLTDNFTVSFWMKHEPPLETSDTFQHTKEHIICNADDHKHNRHHYSIFIRNCRLVLLLRREFNQEQSNVFKPAEWRWKLSEVCDNQWHHYAVSVNFPEVNLYLDGQTFKERPNNYEVIDDWPLHKMKIINTTLVIGACWQGKENKMNFHFRGYLAGLSVLRGQTENSDVYRCLHRCKEGLEEPSSSLIESNTKVFTNSDQTQVTIEGISKLNMEDIVAQVAYINSRQYPSPGLRSVNTATAVNCGNGSILKVPTFHSYILVLHPDQPTIGINGTSNLAQEYDAFKQGIELFSTVSVVVTQRRDQELIDAGLITQQKLDMCKVQMYPPLNHDHEYFKLPTNVMNHLGIHYRESKDGLLIYGAYSSHNYEMFLREIVYYNHKPAYYLNRAFKVVCSGLNGRFISNEYIQTLTVIHPRVEPSHEVLNHKDPAVFAHAEHHDHQVELQAAYVTSKLLENSEAVARTSASQTGTVIIIICVGFLVFMIVLGVIRIRASRRQLQGNCSDDHEMAWDGNSLTITVNPMEQVQEIPTSQKEQTEYSDSLDDGRCYQEDGADSSEEVTEKPKALGLDYNNSKLKI